MNFPAKMRCRGEETYAQCGLAADGAHQDALEQLSKPSCSASLLLTPPFLPLWMLGRAHLHWKPASTDGPFAPGSEPGLLKPLPGGPWAAAAQRQSRESSAGGTRETQGKI